MEIVIREKKWVLLAFGLINVIFLFFPLAKGEMQNYYVFSLKGIWGTFLFASLFYMLMVVPFNAIYHRVYSASYYDFIMKSMDIIVPILGVIALVLFRDKSNMPDSASFTWVYYALYALILIEYGMSNYLTRKIYL